MSRRLGGLIAAIAAMAAAGGTRAVTVPRSSGAGLPRTAEQRDRVRQERLARAGVFLSAAEKKRARKAERRLREVRHGGFR